MGPAGLAALQAAVEQLDPEGRYVKLDVAASTVRYGPELILHSDIGAFVGEEEPARAYLVAWLCTVGGYLPANIELEKTYSIGRPKQGARLDILVNLPDGTPYALIEVKSPEEYGVDAERFIEGQLFNIAPLEPGRRVLAYATANVGDEVAPAAVVVSYADGLTFRGWATSGRPVAIEFPASYGEAAHEHLAKGTAKDIRGDVPAAELDRLRRRLHDVLWRGSTPDNDIYEHVVRLFLTKIYDEKTTNGGDRYRFQRFYTGVQPETSDVTFARINTLYRDAYARYLNPGGAEEPTSLDERKFSADQTAFVVELLQGISLTSTRSGDVLGAFFEGITRDGFKQSKGLFFTHMNVTTFVVKALELDELALRKIQSEAHYDDRFPYIIDPSCGSGTFLLSAMRVITDAVNDRRTAVSRNEDVAELLAEKAPVDHANRWAKDFIFGIDDSELLSMATKVNMVLHRDGNTHIYKADGLASLDSFRDQRLKGREPADRAVYSKRVANSFDAVISNPPFSITLVPSTLRTLDSSFELASDANSENLFLERWYQFLRPGGRLGVVLPESFFATKENLNARLFLFDHFEIRAVVGLPRSAFEPWTPTRTCLLLARKRTEASERSWKDARVRHETRAAAAMAGIQAAERRLRRDVTARNRMTPEEVDALLGAVQTHLAVLEVAAPDSDEELVSRMPRLAKETRAIDLATFGVRKAAAEQDHEILMLSTQNIGYKRTKRTEYDRPNDLFVAVAGRGRGRVKLSNLNKTNLDWRIEHPATAEDALSILRRAKLWQ